MSYQTKSSNNNKFLNIYCTKLGKSWEQLNQKAIQERSRSVTSLHIGKKKKKSSSPNSTPSPSKAYSTFDNLERKNSNYYPNNSEQNIKRNNKTSLKQMDEQSPEMNANKGKNGGQDPYGTERISVTRRLKSDFTCGVKSSNSNKPTGNTTAMTNTQPVSRPYTNSSWRTKTGTEKEMRSTQQSDKTNKSIDSDLMKIETLKSNEGREALLRELDLAIDFDNFLEEEGNVLTDVQNVIKFSELQMKILITDNQDLTNYHKYLLQKRELVELMNIELNKKIMKQIDMNSDIHEEKINSAKEHEDLKKSIHDLKNKSKSRRREMDKTNYDMKDQDDTHKKKVIEKMQDIEEENNNFEKFIINFSQLRQRKIKNLRDLKLDEKKRYDALVKQRTECNSKKDNMQKHAKVLVDGMKIQFEKLDTHKKLTTQKKFQQGDISINDIASSGLNNDDNMDIWSDRGD